MSQVEERLAKLGHEVPDPGTPMFNYVGAVKTGNLVFVAGHGPRREDGEYIYRGKVGQDVDVDAARKAAELTILNCLGSLKQEIGDLDRASRTNRLTSTRVLAGRCSPKNSWRTGLISGRCETSRMKIVTLATSDGAAPAASRMRRRLRKICRVCSMTSPLPTTSPLSSVATSPDT